VGLLLVAGSVLVGARVLATADDTVDVWSLSADVPAGRPLGPDVLEVDRVRFTDGTTAAGYLPAGDALGPGAVAGRDLSAGELLPRSAVADSAAAQLSHLPIVVSASGAPADLRAGDVVDVWVVPAQSTAQSTDGSTGPATRLLESVTVVASQRDSGPLGEAATRQVLIGLDEKVPGGLGELLTAVTTGSVVLIRSGQ